MMRRTGVSDINFIFFFRCMEYDTITWSIHSFNSSKCCFSHDVTCAGGVMLFFHQKKIHSLFLLFLLLSCVWLHPVTRPHLLPIVSSQIFTMCTVNCGERGDEVYYSPIHSWFLLTVSSVCNSGTLITPVSLHRRDIKYKICSFDSLSRSRWTLDTTCPTINITVSADL